jgi:hypothetical protein
MPSTRNKRKESISRRPPTFSPPPSQIEISCPVDKIPKAYVVSIFAFVARFRTDWYILAPHIVIFRKKIALPLLSITSEDTYTCSPTRHVSMDAGGSTSTLSSSSSSLPMPDAKRRKIHINLLEDNLTSLPRDILRTIAFYVSVPIEHLACFKTSGGVDDNVTSSSLQAQNSLFSIILRIIMHPNGSLKRHGIRGYRMPPPPPPPDSMCQSSSSSSSSATFRSANEAMEVFPIVPGTPELGSGRTFLEGMSNAAFILKSRDLIEMLRHLDIPWIDGASQNPPLYTTLIGTIFDIVKEFYGIGFHQNALFIQVEEEEKQWTALQGLVDYASRDALASTCRIFRAIPMLRDPSRITHELIYQLRTEIRRAGLGYSSPMAELFTKQMDIGELYPIFHLMPRMEVRHWLIQSRHYLASGCLPMHPLIVADSLASTSQRETGPRTSTATVDLPDPLSRVIFRMYSDPAWIWRTRIKGYHYRKCIRMAKLRSRRILECAGVDVRSILYRKLR